MNHKNLSKAAVFSSLFLGTVGAAHAEPPSAANEASSCDQQVESLNQKVVQLEMIVRHLMSAAEKGGIPNGVSTPAATADDVIGEALASIAGETVKATTTGVGRRLEKEKRSIFKAISKTISGD